MVRDETTEATLLKEDGTWMVGKYPVVAWLLEGLWAMTDQLEGADLVATNPDNHYLMGVTPATGSVIQFWSGGELLEEFFVGDREFARATPGSGDHVALDPVRQLVLRQAPRRGRGLQRVLRGAEPLPAGADLVGRPDHHPGDLRRTYSPSRSGTPTADTSLNKVSGIEWRLDDGEQEANLTKTVDVIEQFRLFAAEAYPDETEAAGVDFSQTDAVVSLVIEEQDTGVRRDITILFVRRDDEYYHVKDAATDWSYLVTTTSTAAILQPRDWFLTSLKPRPPATTTAP